MKKLLLLFASIFAGFITANAQLLQQENFSYPAGDSILSHGWQITGTSNTNPIKVSSGGLTYSNFIGSGIGNAVTVDSTGQDVCLGFTSQTSGTVYASLLVNVSAVRNGSPYVGDYFFHLTQAVGNTSAFSPRLFVRSANNGKISFGISKSSVSTTLYPTFTDSIYNLNTTYLVVVKYNYLTGTTTDDEVSLFVFSSPALPQIEPATPSAGPVTTTQTDMTAIAAVGLRQGTAGNAPTVFVDGIRVGKNWTDVATLNPYDDPASMPVKNAESVTLDGKLDEPEWANAPALFFGNGVHLKKQVGDKTVTGGFDLKSSFDVNTVTYHIPNSDSSWARVKFLRKGTDLFVGVQSNDKSICRFDWEGEGLFVQIKDNAGVVKEYKLYYQNIAGNKDTIKYEESVLNSGGGAGYLPAGSTANDTTNVDNGYTVELRIRLDKLGYTLPLNNVQISMNIFDPDGLQFNAALPWPYGMSPWDSARGSYFKSWWGSEWGSSFRMLNFTPEPVKFDDPAVMQVRNAAAVIIDGKLDEPEWGNAPSLLFGNGAHLRKQGLDQTVTGGFDIKSSFDVNGVTYHIPNKDSSWARVKFLRKGQDLIIGVQSNDKSICKFDWEGEGLFVQVKDTAGVTKEYKLYYQNIAGNKDTIKYEESVLNSGSGAGFLPAGSTANDTTNVDNGYTVELRVRLDKLGYTAPLKNVQISMNIFDPDGLQFNAALPWPYGMSQWDSVRGSFFKSWWGSEWGSSFKTLFFTPEVKEYDDPPAMLVKNAEAITVDGKLDEPEWGSAPSLLFGNGAHLRKQGVDRTVSGGFDLKASFDVNGVIYHNPNKDSSWARVKFLRKGPDLFIGLQSNDKSICRFDWEGEGLFVQIKDKAGVTKEYKLYYQNIAGNKDTIKYEESVLNSGGGAGFLPAGSTANDTTNVDNGYTAELRIRMDKLGYAVPFDSVQISMNIFDPDGFQFNAALPWPYGMSPWDSARGSYFKSWWGSEWGSSFRKLNFVPEAKEYEDPPMMAAANIVGAVTLDGKLDEPEWGNAPSLLFGNGAQLKKQGSDRTVTGGFYLKAAFDVNGTTYYKPNKDSSWARVKFLHKGVDLFIGVQSNDKSICRFDWEGEGLFVQIKDNAGATKEYKLYYQNIAVNKDTIRYEETILNSGAGAGFLPAGSTANDTTNVDNGYSAELRIRLDKLGYAATVNAVQLSMNIFDPDGYQFNAALPWPYGMNPWDSARGSYFKSWWGSEWGSSFRTVSLLPAYDNPDTIKPFLATTAITLDGKLTETDWASAPTLVFGPPNVAKTGTEKSVTDGFDVKASFNVNGTFYHVPYKDTSSARVKFMQRGSNLYLGIQSNDKSICKFDWEGDGIFLQVKDKSGATKEYKLYYQNTAGNKDTIRYEETVLNSGAGAGFLATGSTVNDTTNIDNGYTAELMIKLTSLGYTVTNSSVPFLMSMNVFDPDGFQHPMAPWDSARGSYYKSWWGSEWGSAFKTVLLPSITGVNDNEQIPVVFSLAQNYPNPFNPSTTIRYSIPATSQVVLKVYNMIGQEVATLVNAEQNIGNYQVSFNANKLATGIYIYRIQAGTFVETKKMMLLK